MHLLIVTRVTHYAQGGRVYAYTPYAREIDIWGQLFERVTIAGTLRNTPPPADSTAFAQSNISVVPISDAGGHGFRAKLRQLLALPRMVRQLCGYMRRADAIHARCPCDLGMLGVVLGPLFSRRLICKYATQWSAYPGEPLTWKAQRHLLQSPWWRGPVTVYGNWPNQPAKVVPFFTSMLDREQLGRARAAAVRPRDPGAFRVLYVGRLSKSKNVDVLIEAFARLRVAGRKRECIIVGAGPERNALEQRAANLKVSDIVRFAGGLAFDQVIDLYEIADVVVLVSDVEGWPKAIAEGMAFGAVCIGTAKGMMPEMLGEGRGFVVPPRDAEALARVLQYAADQPEELRVMAERAAAWAQRYSIEDLREALREVLNRHWAPFSAQAGTLALQRF